MKSRHRSSITLFATFLLGFASSHGQAQVVLNEVLADNRTAAANGGQHPDYIELHNSSPSPVDLGGWSLTDDPLQPRKFIFPPGAEIPAGGFLLVWADLNFGSPGWNAGFGLGSKGDHVLLFGRDGNALEDEIVFGLQVTDFAMGRVPDGTGAWTLIHPSANGTNVAAATGRPDELYLNEWMARPSMGDDWIEVFNADVRPVPLGGLVITDRATGTPGNRAVPARSFIAAGGFVQFYASDLDKPGADHLDFKLSADGETLTLFDADRTTLLDRIVFGPQSQDISQGRTPDGGDSLMFYSEASITPGASNSRELTQVVISEVLSHSDPPFEDAIELQNLTATPVDIGNWWLSDSISQPRKFGIPAGTVIGPHGFKVFYHYQFGAGSNGFALNSYKGDAVCLSEGNASGELTGAQFIVRFGALMNAISAGRHTTSAGVDFIPLARPTFGVENPPTVVQFRQGAGVSNAPARIGPVVINEIFFHPPDSGALPNTLDEFIELHNPTSLAARLYDPLYPTNAWRLGDGITFGFPTNTSISAGGYLVLVSFNPVAEGARLGAFRAAFAVPSAVPVLGPYAGTLADAGAGLELLEPDVPEDLFSDQAGFVPYMIAEKIQYSSAAPWPGNASGNGRSLQRTSPLAYGNEPLNWISALPSPGRPNLIDTDGDGMPDDWETRHGLNPDLPGDAASDADADGTSNLEEYHAGTNPSDPGSVFAFSSVQRAGDSLLLRFHAVQGRAYSVQSKSVEPENSWQTMTNLPPAAANAEMEIPVTGITHLSRLFRLLTPILP